VIYFDAAYITKCYLNEPGANRVREVAYGADGLALCELARLEFSSILKWHVRERHVTRREMTAILKEFEDDEKNAVWQWFSVTSELLEKARKAISYLNERNPTAAAQLDADIARCIERLAAREFEGPVSRPDAATHHALIADRRWHRPLFRRRHALLQFFEPASDTRIPLRLR
jgi:plasmid stabilization system protein ParE